MIVCENNSSQGGFNVLNSIGQGRPLTLNFVLETLTRAIPTRQVEEVLNQVQGKRRYRVRKIPRVGVVWLTVAIGLFSDSDIPGIWR